MRHLLLSLLMLSTPIVPAEEVHIPASFHEDRPFEKLILISDVDGVIRDGVESYADPRIVTAIEKLLQNPNVDVTFISGTPVANDFSVETWRQGNISLNKVFAGLFQDELHEHRVTIFGLLGAHRMKWDGSLEASDDYSPEVSFELGRLLLHAFLQEVLFHGTESQKELATSLNQQLDQLNLADPNHYSHVSHDEFADIVGIIRRELDPGLRLISNGALVETHTSYPLWNTAISSKWMAEEMEKSNYQVSALPPSQRQIAHGVAKRGDQELNFLLISRTNKGITIKRHIEEKLLQHPEALVVTLGDTQVDFPMHQYAHLAFHVGLEKVWKDNKLSQCMMIRGPTGNDKQHLEGTLEVLQLLENGLGQPFSELRYIPHCDPSGQWSYHSIRELGIEK